MSPLDRMRELGIPVGWGTLLVGWDGPGSMHRRLRLPEVVEYACTHGVAPEPAAEALEHLICLADREEGEVGPLLFELAAAEGADPAAELRKWAVLLLSDLLPRLGSDPLDGLLELLYFWAGLDYPAGFPLPVQGFSSDLTPQEYYTVENYQRILAIHRRWLEVELARMQGSAG